MTKKWQYGEKVTEDCDGCGATAYKEHRCFCEPDHLDMAEISLGKVINNPHGWPLLTQTNATVYLTVAAHALMDIAKSLRGSSND